MSGTFTSPQGDEGMPAQDAHESAFVAIPGRDASAVIRGFAYQVDTTILRWLDLRDGEAIELERGEDIDLIARALEVAPVDGSLRETVRVLEQVKHRTASLTLRSSELRATLARFHEHRTANPTLRLILRYTTTAQLGTERGRADGEEGPAIAAWQALRSSNPPVPDETAVITSIRNLLHGGAGPAGVSQSDWEAFQRFVADADADAFRQFVRDIEWSTAAEQAPELGASIRARVLVLGFASEVSETEAVYQRLRAYVWDTLTRDGIKRLTLDDLRREIARPALGARERARIDRLDELLARLGTRVDALERGVAELSRVQERAAADAGARIDALAREAGIRAAVSYVVETPTMEEPPSVALGSIREATVQRLVGAHATASWWAMHGATGTGKSQLALLIARQLAVRRIWLGFRDLTVLQAAARLDAALIRLLSVDARPPLGSAELARLAADLGTGTSIVLDDLPRFGATDELGARILALASVCAEHGVRLLSTSVHRLAVSVTQRLPSEDVALIPAPPFGADETRELLAAHGAPAAALATAVVTMATSITRGHPVLLQALARTLANQGWPATGAGAFIALLNRRPDATVNDETLQRVLETVEDGSSRQLLGRLALAGSEFELPDVQALAEVPPVVDQPRSRLHRITGLWVQAEARQRYSLSPLVRDLGPVDVTADTVRGCHVALAQRIVSRPRINTVEFLQAFSHFVLGGEPNRAAILYMRALMDYNRAPPAEADRIFLSLWVDTPTPEGLAPMLRMQLRALQIRARKRGRLPTESLQADLDTLLSQATPDDASAVFGSALVMLGDDVSVEGVRASLRYVRLAFATWSAVDREWRAHGLPGPPAQMGDLIWVALHGMRTPEELWEWLDLVQAVPPEIRDASFSTQLAYDGAVQAANALLLAEEKRSPDERRWDVVLAALAEMEGRADSLGAEILWAAARSARIMVHGEYRRDLASAEAESRAAISRDVTPETRFLIAKTLGLLYIDVRDFAAAEPWLVTAAETRPAAYARQYVTVVLWAAVVVGRHDPSRAAELAGQAAAWAKERLGSDEMAIVIALGEAALAHALVGEWVRAFEFWDDAGLRVFRTASSDPQAAALLIALSYPLAYFAGFVRYGQPRAGEHDGLPAPERGVMLRANTTTRAPATDSALGRFALVMSHVAEASGLDSGAAAWSARAMDMVTRAGETPTLALAAVAWGADALAAGEEEMLLRRLMTGGAALQAEHAESASHANTPAAALPPATLGEHSRVSIAGDQFAAVYGLLPIVLQLSTLRIEGAHDARTAVYRAVAACRAVADAAGDPPTWRRAAEVIERGFVDGAPARELIGMVESTPSVDDQLSTAVRSVAYLAASLDPAMLPADALRGHLAVLPWLEPALAPHARLYRATLTRFLLTYWGAVFGRARFRFTAPRVVESTLASLATCPPKEATRPLVRRLLDCLAPAVGVRPTASIERWLTQLRQQSVASATTDQAGR